LVLLGKDLRVEVRSRVGWGLLAASAASLTIAVSFAFGGIIPDALTAGALLWVILLLTSMNGFLQSFVREEEQGTALTLRMWVGPAPVLAGKLCLNLLSMLGLASLVVPVYVGLFNLRVSDPAGLTATVVAGCTAIAASGTLLAAIAAGTGARGLLLPLLALPVQLPSLAVAVKATEAALTVQHLTSLLPSLMLLASQAAISVLLSFVLFRYLWEQG
jgi:heme exporter protein B